MPMGDNIREEEQAKVGGLQAVNRMLREQNRVLREAVIWALGYHDFRERQEGEGPYWWRRELMHRSGLTQGDLDQAMRLDETAEQLTDIMLQHKKKAALTATIQEGG